MPKPRDNEKKDSFISRCMGDKEANKDFPDSKQRYAVCLNLWENKSKSSFEDIEKLDIYDAAKIKK